MAGYLNDKVIAITGAGGGIGRAVALACAAEGAKIVVADHGVSLDGREPTSEVADAVVAEIEAAGGQAVAVADDVTRMEAGQRIVDAAVERWGHLDGVVCIAGILREKMLFNMTEDDFDPVVDVHLKGHFTVFRAAAAQMREQRSGTLLGFTSGAYQGSVSQANYSAAKGGIVSLVRSAAVGMRKYGVTANAIAPVAMTRMTERVPMDLAEMGEPEDIAPLVIYLLSDAARHVTGQVYTAAGNKIAVWSQPQEVRAMWADGRWTPELIEARFDQAVGQEEMPIIRRLDEWAAKAAAAKAEKAPEPDVAVSTAAQ